MDIKTKNNLSFCYYPVFHDRETLNDHIARAAWYLSYFEPNEIVFVVKKEVTPDFKAPSYLNPEINNFIKSIKDKIKIIYVDDPNANMEEYVDIKKIDMVLLWNDEVRDNIDSKKKLNSFRKNRRAWPVDNQKVRYEGSQYIKLGHENYPEKESIINENKQKLLRYSRELESYNKSYVFGTGPSVSNYGDFNYSDGLPIICNSIIFDDQMMGHVNPKILCFGDPIFHFGPSLYVEAFHRKLSEVVKKYDILIVIPFNYYRIFSFNFPEFKDRTIAIPIDNEKPINFNLMDDFYLNPYGNILTMLMLPVAATFTDEINILGVDGRKDSENRYFWSHNKKTQINDQMENIKTAHPSFFNINYNEYYENHKKSTEDYFLTGEAIGKKYKILTPSYIPSMGSRYAGKSCSYGKFDLKIAVYDPGFNSLGHSIYFNSYVLRILSKIFSKVLYFEFDKIMQSELIDRPENLKIIQLDNSLKIDNNLNQLIKENNSLNISLDEKQARVLKFEANKYSQLWSFIEKFNSDLLLFTSEGSLSSQTSSSVFSSVPNSPFAVIVHICWKLLQREASNSFTEAVNMADCLFVLEDYLKAAIPQFNDTVYRFPYSMYENDLKLPEKNDSKTLKIGTIGIINDRRNVHFILNTLASYNGDSIEYHLYGKPLGEYGSEIMEMTKKFPDQAQVKLFQKFEYLSNEEYRSVSQKLDFILIAYDESRRYQAPGVLYEFTRSGTPLIVPRVMPFIDIEAEYPGIFVFYDALSIESLVNTLSKLSKKNQNYYEIKKKSNAAMRNFISKNSEKIQFENIRKIFCSIHNKIQLEKKHKKERREIVTNFIEKICDSNETLKKIFDNKTLKKILQNDRALSRICEERFLNNDQTDLISETFNNEIIVQLFSKNNLGRFSRDDIVEAILNKKDLIEEFCSEDEKKELFGCRYNAKSRTDKFYGLFGKLVAAYQIKKAAKEWDRLDKPRLENLKDIHKGKRAFIICNGPSLNDIDFSKLENEITIGTNGLYLSFEETGFKPTYYVIEDDLVGEDRGQDINNIKGTVKLFSQRLAYCLDRRKDVIYLNHCPDYFPWRIQQKIMDMDRNFAPDISKATYGGNTVTYTCMQIAYHLGATEVYIIGADHNYVVPDRYEEKDTDENYVIEAKEDDVNHFNQDYFGKGFRWHNPKVHKIEEAYQNAKKFYEYNNRMIFNATIGGYLEVFDRVNFHDLFKKDYVNQRYQNFLENNKKGKSKGIEYPGKHFYFDGQYVLEKKFKILDSSWEIELVLNSECFNPDYSTFNKTSPPTVLTISPLNIFQITNSVYRIKIHKADCYMIFTEKTWNKIIIKYDKERSELKFSLNNSLIKTVSTSNIKLSSLYKLGNGAHKRFWKGKIGYLEVASFTDTGNRNIEYRLDNEGSEQAKISTPVCQQKTASPPEAAPLKPQIKSIPISKPVLNRHTRSYSSNYMHSNGNSLFLVGNGPSLKELDFNKLKNVKWIGMNSVYRYLERINIFPDYYICLDTVVIKSHKEKINELIQNRKTNGTKLFFLRKTLLEFYPELTKIPEVVFLEDYLNSPYFEGINPGVTTGSFAALLGAMLGYKRIYLLGIDLNYVQQIPEAQKVGGYVLEITETPENNPNYFFDNYQQKGDRYNIPDSSTPNLHYKSWIKVKERLEELGIHVVNCNPKSQLDIFNYAEISEVLPK